MQMMETTQFYNRQASELIKRYDNANMSSLHKLLLESIPQGGKVLDIGFGSGRELQFLHDKGYDVWGMDPSDMFVKNARDRFLSKKSQFFRAEVPFNKDSIGLDAKFDAIIGIAMWMHLKHNLYEDAVESVVSVAKRASKVLISYSQGSRAANERYFEDVDLDYIVELFKSEGFSLFETTKSADSLNRDELTWITVVFKND